MPQPRDLSLCSLCLLKEDLELLTENIKLEEKLRAVILESRKFCNEEYSRALREGKCVVIKPRFYTEDDITPPQSSVSTDPDENDD